MMSIIKQVKKDDVKFLTLQITDLLGVVKEVIIPVEELEETLKNGIWFDGSSVEGFARIQESDLFLKPDPETYAIVPWLTEQGKTARFICDIYKPDGTPFEDDPRYVLKKAVTDARSLNYEFNVGPEMEFYLFRKNGSSRTTPLDYSSYFDLSSHEGYRVLKEIVMALKSFGINVETSHHEVGPGQYEVDFNYGKALEIADKLLTLKFTVKKIAQMHDLHATFMPKPREGIAGSGMHCHQSLFDSRTSNNLFYDEHDKYQLSAIAYGFIAAQIEHVRAMCAILCPTVNSYKRLVSGFEAPVYVVWASMNRSALIRVPHWIKQKPNSSRIELRCADPTCNPYLAFAVMLRAGLKGIKEGLQPPEPMEENVFQFDDDRLKKKRIDVLPTSLSEALHEMENSPFVKEALGVHLFEKYIAIKKKEWNEFKIQVTAWELEKYLDSY
jgi:glutamine synthetase